MHVAQTSAPHKAASALDGARRCLVTGEVLPKDQLIRFVEGPEKQVVADLAQNLPGRGLWVTASREAVAEAIKKNLFSKAAKTSLTIPEGFFDQILGLMRKRCLDFLGLARRAGIAVLGQLQVETELKNGSLALLLFADDASSDMKAFKAARDLYSNQMFTRNELGAALGHDQLVYLGLKSHSLTAKLQAELMQLDKMTSTSLTHANG